MAEMQVVVYGDPVLEQKGKPVENIDDEIRQLVADMYATLKAEPGVGLAAPQVGVSLQLALVDLSAGEDPDALMVMINPEIIEAEGEQREEEGCLSFPGIWGFVHRPARVKVRYQDLDGNWQEAEGTEFLARAFCHEIDHLNGELFINKMSPLKRKMVLKTIRKMQREGTWGRQPAEPDSGTESS